MLLVEFNDLFFLRFLTRFWKRGGGFEWHFENRIERISQLVYWIEK